MNIYNINDASFNKSPAYQDFLKENSGVGFLKIRAYAANQAIPISGMEIEISKVIEGVKVIFFSGTTNSSGLIEKIELPAPIQNSNNLNAPNKASYDINANYNNRMYQYVVNIYDNIYVVQTISVIPKMNMGEL